MPVFAYEAVDANGQKGSREVSASSKDDALKQIRSQGLRPTRIAVKAQPSGESGGEKKKKGLVLFDRVKQAQIVTFTTQLATLQDAGLPIVRSVKILATQQRPGKFQDQLSTVAEEVEAAPGHAPGVAEIPRGAADHEAFGVLGGESPVAVLRDRRERRCVAA